jgi:hypothetical protein
MDAQHKCVRKGLMLASSGEEARSMSLEPRDRDADLDTFIPKRDRQRHREESARAAEEWWRSQREERGRKERAE